MRLLIILCLIGSNFGQTPDVDCVVIHLKYIRCVWNTSDVNYTFYSRFNGESFGECDSYIVEGGLNVGCKQPEDVLKSKRFKTFYTKLQDGEQISTTQEHQIKSKVILNPPSNVTVQLRSDSNLWLTWAQIFAECVENEVRYRVNNNNWEVNSISGKQQEYCINLPSNSSRYELQVRSRVAYVCGPSDNWSEWSDPVVWGPHNKTVTVTDSSRLDAWTVVMYCVGGATLLLLIVLLLHHERIRIILIPVVPKPSLAPHVLKDWLDSSKDIEKDFKASYTERTCSVREYCPVPSSDSESSDSSIISVSTDQTDCYNNIVPNPDPDDSGSSSSAEFVPPEEQHLSV
ncbi:hypothetical protein WMY93_008659 [Mugilogobius chulae]|uniref:Fibronectin type-III domain-containing protein n=1 Tax=Mugilogobius chulae TaxID=88201 RepID=A0AAW0PN23_9GOBI